MSDDDQSVYSQDADRDVVSQWKLTQWFRKMEEEKEEDEELQDHDHISALEFSDDGRFLATGDHSGNVVVLFNDGPVERGAPAHFTFYTEFQSHYSDYSFTKAEDVSPKIIDLKFGPTTNDSVYLIVSSETEIKLWKICRQQQYTIMDWNVPTQPLDDHFLNNDSSRRGVQQPFRPKPTGLSRRVPQIPKLKVPKRVLEEEETIPIIRKTYAKENHQLGIVGLDVTSDNMNFVSADCLGINLWDFNVSERAFKIVDISPEDGEECEEVVSCVHCHPRYSNELLYTTSSGNIRICDLRKKAVPDVPELFFSHRQQGSQQSVYEAEEDVQNWEIEELSNGVSDAMFSKGGKFVISRDYMSIRVWDVAKVSQPVETIYVHEYLRPSLGELKDANYMFDSFKLGLSPTSNIVTGTYGNYFHVLDFHERKDTFIHAGSREHKVTPLSGLRHKMEPGEEIEPEPKRSVFGGFLNKHRKKRKSILNESTEVVERYPHNLAVDKLDFSSKILNCAWHPTTNTVALTGENNVFVYGKF